MRDRRGLGAALVYCVVGPLLVVMVAQTLIRQEADPPAPHVALFGAEAVPHLRAHLLGEGVELVPAPAGEPARDAIRDVVATGGADAALVVEGDPEGAWERGRPLELVLYADTSRRTTQRQVDRLRDLLAAFERQAVEARLVARGLSPGVGRALDLDTADLASSTPRGEALGTMLLVYLLLAPFFASAALAADLVAGERERATLEQLLVQPAPALLLVAAKWVAAVLLGLLGTGVAVVLGATALGRQPLHELGARLDLDAGAQLRMLAILAPLVLAAAAVQVAVAAAARGYKEAQTYLTLLGFLPAVVAMVASFDPTFADASGAAAALPILGQLAALRAVLAGATAGGSAAWSAAACLLLVALCLPLAAGLLRGERALRAA